MEMKKALGETQTLSWL